jgi:transposase
MNIIAIDLGKYNSMCCSFFDTDTQEYSFWNAATTRQYLRTVLEKNPADLVVMEACGPSGWICDLCRELGLETLVCGTNEEAWRWKNVKRKTDKDDALKLARLAMLMQLKPVHVPSQQMREHRKLEVLVTALDDVNRFDNGRQVSAYIGMVPRQHQSGETNRNGRITKQGSRLLRSMLLECA